MNLSLYFCYLQSTKSKNKNDGSNMTDKKGKIV